jgi:hypothetical protein
MNVLDHLLSLIDNGGRRAYLKRRCNHRFRLIPERRAKPDRRKIVDRRRTRNEKRMNGLERRLVF